MRKIFAIVCTVLFCELIFTSFSPSLDGRAVVAEDGVMPQGVFARTVGYLPGDSISVTNLAKKTTVDILVIGDRQTIFIDEIVCCVSKVTYTVNVS